MPAPTATASPLFLREAEVRRGIELLHIAHNRLFGSLDDLLDSHGLGRAHQRALYFVARQPDLTVGQLLGLLGITKQSLSRVVNDLTARSLLEVRAGRNDRRQRLLRLTDAGHTLEGALFERLRAGMSAAYVEAGPTAVGGFWTVLEQLLPEGDRALLRQLRGAG